MSKNNEVQIKIKQRRHEQKAVEPVEYTTMPGNQRGGILHPGIPFHQRLDEIAKLPEDPYDRPAQDCARIAQIRECKCLGRRKGKDGTQKSGNCSFPGLFRAHALEELVASERPAS